MLCGTPLGAVGGDVGFGAFLEGLLDGSNGKCLRPFGAALVERVDLSASFSRDVFGLFAGLLKREGAGHLIDIELCGDLEFEFPMRRRLVGDDEIETALPAGATVKVAALVATPHQARDPLHR